MGCQLYQAIETQAPERGLARLFAEVSITARPFFERCGFMVQSQQTVVRCGVELTNFKMEKPLLPATISDPPIRRNL